MSSSTSSSERRGWIPWGALWAAGFALAAELALRQLPPPFFFSFDQNEYHEQDAMDYAAVDLAVRLLPTPEVMVTGTSRSREGVQSPELAAALAARLGRSVTVRNYATGGGRIDVSLALFDRLVRADKLPRVLVVGLDASDFRDAEPHVDRYRLVDLATLPRDVARSGWPTERDLSHVLGNSLPLRLALARLTVRYRLVRRGPWDFAAAEQGNPVLGGTTSWARLFDQQLASRAAPPKMRADERRLAMTVRGYVVHERPLARLRELAAAARGAGVALVLAELPIAPVVRDEEPVRQAQARLRAELAALTDERHVWSFALPSAEADFSKRQFRDPSHLNSVGARAFVAHIAPVVAAAVARQPVAAAASDPQAQPLPDEQPQ